VPDSKISEAAGQSANLCKNAGSFFPRVPDTGTLYFRGKKKKKNDYSTTIQFYKSLKTTKSRLT
jgi:hypothetical protein